MRLIIMHLFIYKSWMSTEQFQEAKGCNILTTVICVGIRPHPMQFRWYHGGWEREWQVKSSKTTRRKAAEPFFVCRPPVTITASSCIFALTALRELGDRSVSKGKRFISQLCYKHWSCVSSSSSPSYSLNGLDFLPCFRSELIRHSD